MELAGWAVAALLIAAIAVTAYRKEAARRAYWRHHDARGRRNR